MKWDLAVDQSHMTPAEARAHEAELRAEGGYARIARRICRVRAWRTPAVEKPAGERA